MKHILLLSITLIIMNISCSNKQYVEHREILLEDTPSAYKQGYIDGCGSGENVAGNFMTRFKRSEAYLNDELYKRAWDVGYEYCKEQLEEDQELERLMHH